MILLTYIIINILDINITFELTNINIWIIGVTYIVYKILYEILHSIGYLIYGAKWNKIRFRVCLEKSIMCCLCKQNITRKNILESLILRSNYIYN